jgi:hypothetical protein
MKATILSLTIVLVSSAVKAQTQMHTSGVDIVLDVAWGYRIYPRDSPVDALIEKSKFTSTVENTYILQTGDDGYRPETALNVNNARITGNYLDYVHPNRGFMHAIIAGYNLDYQITYNYINRSYFAVVAEAGFNDGSPMVNTNYVISGNIFRNNVTPVSIAGYDNLLVSNNTFYNERSDAGFAIKISESNGTTVPAICRNIRIMNNIVFLANSTKAIYLISSCDQGLLVDYNLYYSGIGADNEPEFAIDGITHTWSEWRALGYDEHSVIIDPNFNNSEELVPATPLYYGTDLGFEHAYSLSTDASWIVGYAPNTTRQGTTWQVGAKIYEDPTPTTTCVSLGGICCAPFTTCDGTSLNSSDCDTTCCNGECTPFAPDGGSDGEVHQGDDASTAGDGTEPGALVGGCACGAGKMPANELFLLALAISCLWRRHRLRRMYSFLRNQGR